MSRPAKDLAGWAACTHFGKPAHHSSRQPSPARVMSCAICVRPWPDSGLPRVVFPSGPGELEGRLPSLLVHPASLPIPPFWVTQHRLSSGQHTVSLSTGQTDDIAHPQRAFRPALMRRETSFIALSTIDKARGLRHFNASDKFSIQSTLYQAIQLLQVRWYSGVSFFSFSSLIFSSCLSASVFLRVGILPRLLKRLCKQFAYDSQSSSYKPYGLLHVGLVYRRE